MKSKFLIIPFAFSFLLTAQAGTPDPRFEGVWVGNETYTVNLSSTQLAGSEPVRTSAAIVIGPGGKEFGVIEGLGPGKYLTTSRSNGNKLIFASHLSGTGRTSGTFELSADGNTITENGFGLLPGRPYAVECSIKGTFHRKAKK